MNLAEANKIRDAIASLRSRIGLLEEAIQHLSERTIKLEEARFHVEPNPIPVRRAVGRPRKT